MDLRKKADICDGCIFRCKSLRVGSFFGTPLLVGSRIYLASDAAEEARVGQDTAINVYQWLREVCSTKLLGMNIQLGGPGNVVQIDESVFRRKP